MGQPIDLGRVRQVLVRDGFLTESHDRNDVLSPSFVEALKKAAVITDRSLNGVEVGAKLTDEVKKSIIDVVVPLNSGFCGLYAPAPSKSGIGIKTFGTTHSGWDRTAFTFRVTNLASIVRSGPGDGGSG